MKTMKQPSLVLAVAISKTKLFLLKAGDFDEAKQPRAQDGKWTDGGGGEGPGQEGKQLGTLRRVANKEAKGTFSLQIGDAMIGQLEERQEFYRPAGQGSRIRTKMAVFTRVRFEQDALRQLTNNPTLTVNGIRSDLPAIHLRGKIPNGFIEDKIRSLTRR